MLPISTRTVFVVTNEYPNAGGDSCESPNPLLYQVRRDALQTICSVVATVSAGRLFLEKKGVLHMIIETITPSLSKSARILWTVVFLLVVTSALSEGAPQETGVIREILEARMRRFENLIVEYSEWTDHSPSGVPPISEVVFKTKTGRMVMTTGTEEMNKEFSCLKDMSRYDFQLKSRDRKLDREVYVPEHARELRAFTIERVELLLEQKGADGSIKRKGEIRDRRPVPDSALEAGLAMRLFTSEDRLNSTTLANMKMDVQEDGNILMHMRDQENLPHEFVLSKDLDYAPVAYRMRTCDTNKVFFEIKMEEFKNVDGMMLPHKMELERCIYTKAGAKQLVQAKKIVVQEFRFNDPNNVPQRYRIKWPEGTYVYDERSGAGFKVKKGALDWELEEKIFGETLDRLAKEPGSVSRDDMPQTQNAPVLVGLPEPNDQDQQQQAGDESIGKAGQSLSYIIGGLLVILVIGMAGYLATHVRKKSFMI